MSLVIHILAFVGAFAILGVVVGLILVWFLNKIAPYFSTNGR